MGVSVTVGVAVTVSLAVAVAVAVAVLLGVAVGVSIGVLVGMLAQNPVSVLWMHTVCPAVQVSATPPEQSASAVQLSTVPAQVLHVCAQNEQSANLPSLPQQPGLCMLPHGVTSQVHTQHTPCATGTQARAASVVTAVTYSATQSDRWEREIEHEKAFGSVLKFIRLPWPLLRRSATGVRLVWTVPRERVPESGPGA